VDVLRAQAVLVAVLDEALRGIDQEDALPRVRVLLVEHENARRNACAVEEVWRQADDPLHVPAPDDLAPDHPLGAAAEEDAVRQVHRRFARALQALEDVEDESEVTVLGRRHAELKALNASAWALKPLLHALNENGGLATRKSKRRSSLAVYGRQGQRGPVRGDMLSR